MNPDDEKLRAENAELRARLEETEETLRAIRSGEVDALMVQGADGPQLFVLQSADAEASRFRSDILAKVSEAIVALDEQRRVVYLNAAAERQYAVEAAQVLGRPLAELYENRWLSPEDRERALAAIAERGQWRGRSLHVKRGGEIIHVETSVSRLLDKDGAPAGLLAVIRDISDRIAVEAEARARTEENAALVDALPAFVWTCLDPDCRVITGNRAANELLGVVAATNVSQSALAHGEGVYLRQLKEDGTEYRPDELPLQRAIATGQPVRDAQLDFRFADGRRVLAVGNAIPLLDAAGQARGAIGAFLDLTERRRAELDARFLAEISQHLANLTTVTEIMEVVGARLSEHLALSLCNFVDISEAGDEVVVRSAWHRPDVPSSLGRYRLAEFLSPEYQATLRAGRPFIVRDTAHDPRTDAARYAELKMGAFVCMPLVQDGRWRFTMNIHDSVPRDWLPSEIELTREITTRVWARLERVRIESELADRVADLARADRSKDEFLAMLAHELRNPLAPLRNATEILRNAEASAEEHTHAQRILERQIENMSRMIDDLLDVSRITEGKIELRRAPVSLEAVLTAATSLARSGCAAHRQELKLTLPAEPVWLLADATRLEQVFGNLLGNASKYSGEGSHITVLAERAGEEVLVRVRDDGAGIDPELLPRIFDLFVQATRSLDRAHGGLGIGLTLAQRLVKLHGGAIEAHSAGLGHGSEFLVRLPILLTAPAPPAPASPAAPLDTPRRLLIVDDNTDSARSMAMIQRRRGHVTRTAFTGPEAVAVAEEFLPEIVLLDIGLPGMDGFEVARRVRALPGLGGVFIVAMSGYGSGDDRAEAKGAGFDEYLVKPVDLDELRALIARR